MVSSVIALGMHKATPFHLSPVTSHRLLRTCQAAPHLGASETDAALAGLPVVRIFLKAKMFVHTCSDQESFPFENNNNNNNK